MSTAALTDTSRPGPFTARRALLAYFGSVAVLAAVTLRPRIAQARAGVDELLAHHGGLAVATLATVLVVITLLVSAVALLVSAAAYVALAASLDKRVDRRAAAGAFAVSTLALTARNLLLAALVGTALVNVDRLSVLRHGDPFVVVQLVALYRLGTLRLAMAPRRALAAAAIATMGGVVLSALL